MKTILVVVGTRPEAIKLAPVILAIQKKSSHFKVKVCSTAQHRHILDPVLNLFQISPDIDLNLMQNNQSISDLTARAMVSLTQAIRSVAPDLVMVQGDTTTAMVAAMAAFYQRIPVAHIEAGLRTKNILNPFPEEMNRRVISVLGQFHFAPTVRAVNALVSEGVPKERVYLTGNTVIDALQLILQRSENQDLKVKVDERKIILVTAHRRESFGEPLQNICEALRLIASRNPDVHIVYSVHPNPSVQDPVRRNLLGKDNISLLDPLEYHSFVKLMNACYFILTDSGGIQEEGPALGKPVLVMREETERFEGIEAGASKLIGTQSETILAETEKLLRNFETYQQMAKAVSCYGDGTAAEKISNLLVELL